MSSFSPNVAPNPGRNVYMPLAPAVFPGAVMVPARFPQGFPVHADINAINRPAMGQSNPPAQPASAQQGGSVLPWVLGGAAGLGALYLGYKWLSKPKAEEAAEKLEGEASDLAKGETEKLADAAGKETAEKSVQGVAAESKGALGAATKDASAIAHEGIEQAEHKVAQALETTGKSRLGSIASSMRKNAWSVATHKGTLAGIALAGGLVLNRMVPTLKPAAIALGAEVPGMLWKSCAENAKQCSPGLAQKAGNGLLSLGTGIGAFATTTFAASKNVGSGLLAKVWNTCGENAAKECIPGLAQKAGADQVLQKGMDYVPAAVEGTKTLADTVWSYRPTVEGTKNLAGTVWSYKPTVEGTKNLAGTVWSYKPTVEGTKNLAGTVWSYKPTVEGAQSLASTVWSYKPTVEGTKNLAGTLWSYRPTIEGTKNLASAAKNYITKG